MSFEISGINNLIKKLNNLEAVNVTNEVEEVAQKMQASLRNSASSFSKNEYKCIVTCEARCYGNKNCFIDVGLKNDNAPFESWKGLYFQNFGYRQFYYGHDLKKINTTHVLWFDNAVSQAAEQLKKELKDKLKDKIKNALEG